MPDPIDTDTALRWLDAALPVGMPPGHAITDEGRAIVEADALRMVLAEVDRLRAENAEYRQMQKAYKAHVKAVAQAAAPLRPLDPDDGTVDWGGRSPLLHLKDAVTETLRLRVLEADR